MLETPMDRKGRSFTSLPCAQDTGGEDPCIDTKDVEASDCGRLGRQAADHPWSALRVVKAAEKTAQRPRCCSKLKQQLCIQNGTRASDGDEKESAGAGASRDIDQHEQPCWDMEIPMSPTWSSKVNG
jgi:hypothetical protein